jgi:D-alanyl-lipoteichoic acid acyltransferase DltB (MBOAT superfamily)
VLFNSYPFVFLFLPAALAGFFALGRLSARAAAAWLTLVSLVFYGYWDIRYLALLLGSILVNYAAGRGLYELRQSERHRAKSALLIASIAVNLLVLGYFKYMDFFLTSLDTAFSTGWQPLNIILPLGISFFTFTQITFLVDTARGEVREFNLVHYALFVSYFPHLIAGPILHHREMMPQFRAPSTYRPLAENFAVGLSFFAIGLAKKCLLADGFAPGAAHAFGMAQQGHVPSMLLAWQGMLAYTLQLYFDFSGYSDMAVGLSRLFGIRLPYNFASPYQATNMIDFWRRWHMTLSRFLRDYLYIPLGGNRRGPARRYVNLMLTMLLGGLWHGANWTFVVWGGLHGLYLIANHGWRAVKPDRLLQRVPGGLRRLIATALTFAAVALAWVFFRAADMAAAMRMLEGIAGLAGLADPAGALPVAPGDRLATLRYIAGIAIVFLLPNSQTLIEPDRQRDTGEATLPRLPLAWRGSLGWGVALGILAALSVATFSQVSEFLYWRF